jgi:hypothetical protein
MLSNVSCSKEVCAMFRKPVWEKARNEVVLNAGFDQFEIRGNRVAEKSDKAV